MAQPNIDSIQLEIIETPQTVLDPTQPPNQFKRPHRCDKTVSDIEDIIVDTGGPKGVCRPRPDTVKWLCPFTRRLIPNEEYRWCQCGKSGDIFCDDACTEEPTNRGPLVFQVQAMSRYALCGCRYTSAPPFCDGAHILPQVGLDEWLEAHPEDKEKLPWIIAQREAAAGGCCKSEEVAMTLEENDNAME